MRKQVITVTFHCANNYGAVLQAYALQKYINKNYNDDNIEWACLEYRPEYLLSKAWLESKKRFDIKNTVRNIITYHSRKKRIEGFEKFIKEYINEKNIENISEEETLFLVGSDQVWNKDITGGSYDEMYFLENIKSRFKYSYAASVGHPISQEDSIYRHLKNFRKIGVREKDTYEAFVSFGLKNVSYNVDPVFLLSKNEYKQLAIIPTISNYILIYTLEYNGKIKKMVQKYKERNLKVVSVGTFKNYYNTDVHFSNATPKEFLGLIFKANKIISNSFHTIAFSIIFEKDFEYVPLTNNRGNRIENLISLINVDSEKQNQKSDREDLDLLIDLSKKYIDSIVSEFANKDLREGV